MTKNVMITPFVNEGYNEQNVAYTEHMVEISCRDTTRASLATAELSLQELADLLWQAGITLPSPTREKLQVGDVVVGYDNARVMPFEVTAIGKEKVLYIHTDNPQGEYHLALSQLEGATVRRGDGDKKFVVTTDF